MWLILKDTVYIWQNILYTDANAVLQDFGM